MSLLYTYTRRKKANSNNMSTMYEKKAMFTQCYGCSNLILKKHEIRATATRC